MDQLQEISSIIALTLGVAWASGINLYATMATLGLLGASGNMTLPQDLQILQEPLVIFAAGLMYLVEFFADKIPGIDSGWDTVHTFIRIPAGALLAAGAVGEVNPAVGLAAALLGGGLAAGTHFTKAGTRLLLNTSPEPVTNVLASVSEDAIVIGGLVLAWNQPWIFIGLVLLFITSLFWILPRLWRAIRSLKEGVMRLFRRQSVAAATSPGGPPSLPLEDDEDTLP